MNLSSKQIPIEDDPCDVIGKAMRGLGISHTSLAEQTDLTEEKISSILAGEIDAPALGKIANALNLSATALIELHSYHPNISPPDGFAVITSPFGHAGVNSFVISHGGNAVVFDTGTDSSLILNFLSEQNLQTAAVIITHRHHDHVSGVADFGNTPVIFPDELEHGQVSTFGGISFTALDVSGHAKPARAYLYQHSEQPICMLGDCLFAGSIGGTTTPENYQLALKTLRISILSLPENTILAPGHGPLTCLNLERDHNPFITK